MFLTLIALNHFFCFNGLLILILFTKYILFLMDLKYRNTINKNIYTR